MADRIDLLLRSIDVATSKGLELGPLASPVVRREMGDIRYIDHVDVAGLRARYETHDGFDIDAIVPIDYVSRTGSIRVAVGEQVVFDYVIASHIIEHVPDLIRWLGDIRSVLRGDGVLSLAIPDHRRCFDSLRAPTVTADVIHAHLTGATVPSPGRFSTTTRLQLRGMVSSPGESSLHPPSWFLSTAKPRPSLGLQTSQRRASISMFTAGCSRRNRSPGCSLPFSDCNSCRSRSTTAPNPSTASSSSPCGQRTLARRSCQRSTAMVFRGLPRSMPRCDQNFWRLRKIAKPSAMR